MDASDSDYRVQCDICGASIVARNTDVINRIKYLRSLEDPDEFIACSICAYNKETDSAAICLVQEFKMSTIPVTAIVSALTESGVPSSVLCDESIMSRLQIIVRNKVLKIRASEYGEQTDQAASAIENSSTNYSSTQVPNSVVKEKLLNSGIPAGIIQSKNINDKLLVVELVKIVKQKMKKVEPERVSPLGASVDDYETQTDQAASAIENSSTNYSSTQVPNSVVKEKLLNSGIPAGIIQSKNINDKLLVVELVKIVKQKMAVDRTVASSFNRDQSLSRDERIAKARQYANRMTLPDKKGVFRARVCITCDRHIIGTEEVCYLTNVQLKKNLHRIGVESYDDYYTKESNGGFSELPSELVKQYEVDGLEGLLLSRRSRRIEVGGLVKYESCKSCFDSIRTNVKLKSPPKFAIANGFVIGQIPRVFRIRDENEIEEEVVVDKDEINDIVRAMLAPTRAYGYTFSYFAGAQQSIQGQFMFYEVDQSLMASVYNRIQESGANPHVHIVLGGRFTPSQKTIIRKKTAVNTELVTKLLTWFVQKSGHTGFEDLKIDAKCPQPMRDEEVGEDFELDKETESQFDGGTYYFSSANTSTQDTGVFGTELKFTKSLLERTPPTLLAYGGDYKGGRDLRLEDIIPTAFPWGLGGPSMKKRRTKISLELTLAHYGRLSLDQFMKGDFCLMASHMLDRRLSYTSGKVKCRSNIDGIPLAEKISRLTVKDLENVVSGDNTNAIANQLLTSVSASCKAMGHTSEAAAHWRRIYFALSDRYGLNAFMLTVTPNDLVNFTVRVIALAGEEHTMPSLDSSELQCIADFNLRKKTRLDFPGACSLNFQSVMQIVLEVLLGWDPERQKGSEDGIFGELDAWGMTVEEQARKTLHSHWLLWSKKLAKMRDELFSDDKAKQKEARADFCKRVDMVLSASYTDSEWEVEHKCGAKGKVSETFKECDLQVLRDARHKILCQDICGKVMECKGCKERVTTQDIINLALNEWHQNALKDDKTSAKNLTFPLSKERQDIAMYRTSYDMMSGCYEDDKFWGNEDVRRILQISGDNEHCALHGPRCFKKGVECTSGSFPQAACTSTDISIDEEAPVLEWYLLNGDIKRTVPWLILPKRPLGCQYLNTHNVPISTIFNCNSNVIIGDASNTFYLTLYGSKSTQKEDGEKKERIMKKLIRRLKRLQIEREQHAISNIEDDKGDFAQGLSMILSAMNASTSRDVVSSPMAHYLVAEGGERFSASHEPKHLLIHQMEETLDGKAVNFTLRRTNKSKADGTTVRWPDSSSHDYLYRPSNPVDMEISGMDNSVNFEDMCAYKFTEHYEKNFYSFKDMDADKQDIIAPGTEEIERYRFIEGHPGREFAYTEKLKLPAVVVVSLPEGKLCLLKDLELGSATPSDVAKDKREDYAKMALVMFYPFRTLDDLKTGGSYWTTYKDTLDLHLDGHETRFWKTGFEILQNIDDRAMMMQSDHKTRARDRVQKETKVKVDEVMEKKSKGNAINDISFFCDDEESIDSDVEDDEEGLDSRVKWTHNVLIERSKNITDDRIISARVTSNESIFQSSDDSHQIAQEEGTRNINTGEELSDWFRNRSYPTLLRFISGTLVGTTNYDDVYGDELMLGNIDDEDVHVITQDDDLSQNELDTETCNVPTLVGTARKIAREDNMKLDKKQYIAYEIIACTFLLQLVEEGRDSSSILGRYLASAVGTTANDMDQLVKHLKARGGMEQLIMFLTGPAGAGKSTAVKVAQRFCFEFCAAVSVMWYDETFYFTACSGSAAAIFGGVTIHSAIKLNGKITDKARQAWKARILVVDEISYYSDNDLKKTDRKLKDLNGIPNKPFGGQSIIFCGDFRQFEAIKAKHLLYDRNGSQLWENSINCVIILENIHRFKDDPEFGEMLTRLWRDDLTREDREKINTRVVGRNGVTLPSTFDGDVVYACSTNKERNAVQAGIFRDHIRDTHPSIASTDSPPQHTIIIEAVIQSTKSKEASTSIGSFTSTRIVHTCGDADCVVNDTKFVDPSLRLYVGAHCMCTVDNKRLKDKVPIGNGTLCRVVGIKLSDHAPSHRWQNWDGRKVSTVSAKHVDWVEFEYHPKSKSILKLEDEIKELEWELKVNQESYEDIHVNKRARTTTTCRRMMSDPIIQDITSELNKKKLHLKKEQQTRRFKLEPQTSSATVSFKLHDLSRDNETARCKMTQIQVVLADSITGHKLQGMTIPYVIIASWGYFAKNWPYVVLSRCTTFKGLYLFKPIDMEKSFAPSRDLVEYLRRAEDLQDHIIQMREISIAELANENNGIVP